jgi:lipoprotein NlpD
VAVEATSATLGGVNWLKPTSGKIIQPYTASTKGVDVQGKEGQDIFAAYGGTVAYSGSGLKGYGNLVIIKHSGNYLTAYSHNKLNLVKEGDTVKRGQKIAELGKTESDRPLLHFELRKSGKPIDPTPIFTSN